MIAAAAAFEEGDSREHPNLKALNSLHLTYPGYERDKREAEAVHLGHSSKSLNFDAAIRRLKVKQRAHEEQKSIRDIHRSHPNLVSLDALKLTYPGWQQDFQAAEAAHNKNPNCDFMEILRKIQVKQLRFENDRSHYRLIEIDNLKLSYPGWKADLRNLEKFHFEEAFFLPGDSLFQSKLDGLKRRQQIYLRSQKVRANKGGQQSLDEPEEESSSVVVLSPPTKQSSSYAILTTPNSKPEPEPYHFLRRATPLPSMDEERTDRQQSRAPYAVILDAEPSESQSLAESVRTPVDPPNRPDPPESDAESTRGHPLNAQTRQSVDCDEQSNDLESREAIDCDAELPEEEQELFSRGSKSDPQGYSGDEHANRAVHHRSWPSKLSSYIDLGPISEPEESEGATSEDHDDLAELPPPQPLNRYATPVSSNRRSKRSIRPRGIYSAPPMPACEDDGKSLASRAMSAATGSSSRAVFTSDVSAASQSQSSTQAVWSEENTVASATSSRAVWSESPNPYTPQTPSSIRPVWSMPDTPAPRDKYQVQRSRPVMSMPETPTRERDQPPRSRTRGSTSERIRRTRRATEDRSRRAAEDRSRVSRSNNSKASSMASSRSKKLGRCTICGDPDKNHVFVPCGHLCACKQCADQVISRKMTCPVCRGKVTEAIQVFL